MIRLQSFIVPSLFLATIQLNEGCGSQTTTDYRSAAAEADVSESAANDASNRPMDLGLVADFATALKATDTKLLLNQADYRQFARLIPGQFAALIDQILKDSGIETVSINEPDALISFKIRTQGFEVNLGINAPLILSDSISIHSVERISSDSDGVRIAMNGISIGNSKIKTVIFMQDTSAELSLEDDSVIRTPALIDLANSDDWSMPTAGQLLSSVFVLSHVMTKSSANNRIHFVGKLLDPSGREIRDSNGQVRLNSNSALRMFFRNLLVEYQNSPEYLALFDQITEVRVDRGGMKFWLNRPIQLRFSLGSLMLSQSFSLRSYDAATILPVQGISTTAVGADGAILQNLRIRSSREATFLDAQVYGYRSTILGKFGKTEVISFPF
jgi:hypothetical protein